VMRQRAIHRGLRLNEYGLFKSDVETRDPKLLVLATLRRKYSATGPGIHPAGIARGRRANSPPPNKALPHLLEWTQLKGSLHNHSIGATATIPSRKSPPHA